MTKYRASLRGDEAEKLLANSDELLVFTYISFGPHYWPEYNSKNQASPWLKFISRKFKQVDITLTDTLQWRNALISNLIKNSLPTSTLPPLNAFDTMLDGEGMLDIKMIAENYTILETWIGNMADVVQKNKDQVSAVRADWQERMAKVLSPRKIKEKISTQLWDDCLKQNDYSAYKTLILNELASPPIKRAVRSDSNGSLSGAFAQTIKKRCLDNRNRFKSELDRLKANDIQSYKQMLAIISLLTFDYLLEEAAELYHRCMSYPDDNIVYVYPTPLNDVLKFLIEQKILNSNDEPKIHFLEIKLTPREQQEVVDSEPDTDEDSSDSDNSSDIIVGSTSSASTSQRSSQLSSASQLSSDPDYNQSPRSVNSSTPESKGEIFLPPFKRPKKLGNSDERRTSKQSGDRQALRNSDDTSTLGSSIVTDKSSVASNTLTTRGMFSAPSSLASNSDSSTKLSPLDSQSMFEDSTESPRSNMDTNISMVVAEMILVIVNFKFISYETRHAFKSVLSNMFNIANIRSEKQSTSTSIAPNAEIVNDSKLFEDITITFNERISSHSITELQEQFNIFWSTLHAFHVKMTVAKHDYFARIAPHILNAAAEEQYIYSRLHERLNGLEKFLFVLSDSFKSFINSHVPVLAKPTTPAVFK